MMSDDAQDFVNKCGGRKATADGLLAELESGTAETRRSWYSSDGPDTGFNGARFEFGDGTALIIDNHGWGFGFHRDHCLDGPPEDDGVSWPPQGGVPRMFRCRLRVGRRGPFSIFHAPKGAGDGA